MYKKDLIQRVRGNDINLPLTLFICAAIISLVFYVEPVRYLRSAIKLKYFFAFLTYYFFLIHRPTLKKIKRYYYIILCAFTLVLLFILLQNYLGSEIIPYRFKTFQWNLGGRIYPLYGQFSSMILMIVLPVLIFAKNITRKGRLLLAIMLAPILVTTYLCYSRTSVISIMLTLPVMLIFMRKRLLLLAYVLVLLAVGTYYVNHSEKNLVSSVINLTDKDNVRRWSNMTRINMLKDTANVFKAHPVTGIGYYGYGDYSRALDRKFDKIFNDSLNVLVTMGLLGFIPFVWLIFILLKQSYLSVKLLKIKAPHDDFFIYLSFGIFLSFISFLINGMFEGIFFNAEPLMLMLLLLSLNKIIINEVVAGLNPT